MLLLWLSLIVINPFDISTVDSGSNAASETLSERMVQMGRSFLHSPSKTRDGAALFLARLLTRPDMRQKELPHHLAWSVEQLRCPESSVFLKCGVALTLTYIFKFGKREDLLDTEDLLPVIARFVCSSDGHEQMTSGGNALLRKLYMKLIQRVALTYLKQRVVKWRYRKGRKSLLGNLIAASHRSRNENGLAPSAVDATVNNDDDDNNSDDDIEIPEDLEDIIGALLDGLSDTDTIVRWSAAKGLGRITMRLPRVMADDIVMSLLDLFQDDEEPNTWHGGCLALAELARRGLLLPSRLEQAINDVVLPALLYDKRKGSYSVGNHVRDAACYVCWAFARAYDPHVMQPFVHNLAVNLVITSVYDREINVRRAASAAFQEHVGRQGNFPHGIDILTRADYFTLSNRQTAYLDISVYISQFEEYCRPLIDHLVDSKISHWDKAIRELAAQTLSSLAMIDQEYMEQAIIPKLVPQTLNSDLSTRHGALVALGNIVVSLNRHRRVQLNFDMQHMLRQVVIDVNSRFQSKGRGGEIMREGMCVYIGCLARARVALPATATDGVDMVAQYQAILNENLRHPNNDIIELAVQSFKSFCDEYYDRCAVWSVEKFVQKVMGVYIATLHDEETNFAARRGCILALGVIPRRLLEGRFEHVVDILIKNTRLEEKSELRDAESRRNAIRALIQLCERSSSPDDDDDNITTPLITATLSNRIFQAFVDGIEDYATDNRGDVGSWVREACMKAMEQWVHLLCTRKQLRLLLTPSMMSTIVCSLMKQACEKIDRVRDLAGNILERLIVAREDSVTYQTISQMTPHHARLEDAIKDLRARLQDSASLMVLDWSSPEITFPLFAEMGLHTEMQEMYMYPVLSGFVLSIGGLTNHVVKSSSETLVEFMMNKEGQNGEQIQATICQALIRMHEQYAGQDRVVIPLLKTHHLLLSRDCLEHAPFQLLRELVLGLQREVSSASCRSVVKLLEAVPVFCELLRFNTPNDEIRRRSYGYLFHLLVNRYPRVRLAAGEKLLNAIQVFAEEVFCEDGMVDCDELVDNIAELLMDTDWASNVASLRPVVVKLYDTLGLPKPKSLQGIKPAE